MELYVGGAWQGKLDYVLAKYKRQSGGSGDDAVCRDRNLIVAQGENCSREDLENADIINHFHAFVKRELDAGKDTARLIEWLYGVNPNVIIVCDEVGSGIIPAEKADRDYREQVGRLLCEAAGLSSHMERITGGIGMKIK